MSAGDQLGQVEFAVLAAVHRGALRSRHAAGQVSGLGEHAAGEALLHAALRRCEQDGLVRSQRDRGGRQYELTAAGRARLRRERRFRAALVGALLRSSCRLA